MSRLRRYMLLYRYADGFSDEPGLRIFTHECIGPDDIGTAFIEAYTADDAFTQFAVRRAAIGKAVELLEIKPADAHW